jgi:hypothetical protein
MLAALFLSPIATGAVAALKDFPQDDPVRQIDIGQNHFCAITGSGALVCWGDNQKGQIGDGLDNSRARTPTLVIDRGVTQVSAGYAHTCAVVGAALDCWGWNRSGQIGSGKAGDGESGDKPLTPQRVIAAGVTAVSAGGMHTCALVTGALQCWGYNAAGQIGTGAVGAYVLKPVPVIADGVSHFSAGGQHSCAVVRGALQCWGENRDGQIGNGAAGAAVPVPTTVIPSGVTAVAAGSNYTCAVANGALWCWGRSDATGIGPNAKTKVLRPRKIIDSGVTAVATGEAHTCAIVRGALQCWGYNSVGGLGTGNWGEIVVAPREVIAAGVTAVATGQFNTCAIVDGGLRCRGQSAYGQITSMEPDHLQPFSVGQADAKSLDLRAAYVAAQLIRMPERIARALIGRLILEGDAAYTIVGASGFRNSDTEALRLFLEVYPVVTVTRRWDTRVDGDHQVLVAADARCGGEVGVLGSQIWSTRIFVVDQDRLLSLADAIRDDFEVLPEMEQFHGVARIEAGDRSRLQACAEEIQAAADARPYARLRYQSERFYDVPPTRDGMWVAPANQRSTPVTFLMIEPKGKRMLEELTAEVTVDTVTRCGDTDSDDSARIVSSPWRLSTQSTLVELDRRILDADLPYATARSGGQARSCQRIVTGETYSMRDHGKLVERLTVAREQQPIARPACDDELPLLALHVANDIGHSVMCGEYFATCRSVPNAPTRSIVALAFPREHGAAEAEAFDLDVLIVDSSTSKVISRLPRDRALVADAALPTSISIDTANYALAPEVRAFGVRVEHELGGHFGSFHDVALNLYVADGASLKPVLTDFAVAESSQAADGECTGGSVETRRTLHVASTRSHGYADLLVKSTITTTELGPAANENADEGEGECVEKAPVRSTAQEWLRYDGEKYQASAALSPEPG